MAFQLQSSGWVLQDTSAASTLRLKAPSVAPDADRTSGPGLGERVGSNLVLSTYKSQLDGLRRLSKREARLAAHDYVGIAWMFDHAEPDRDHLVQTAWNGRAYDYDEWIGIAGAEFDFIGIGWRAILAP